MSVLSPKSMEKADQLKSTTLAATTLFTVHADSNLVPMIRIQNILQQSCLPASQIACQQGYRYYSVVDIARVWVENQLEVCARELMRHTLVLLRLSRSL